MQILKDGRMYLGHINAPLIIRPETELFQIAMAFNILGLEMHIQLVDKNPINKFIIQCIEDYENGKYQISTWKPRWP